MNQFYFQIGTYGVALALAVFWVYREMSFNLGPDSLKAHIIMPNGVIKTYKVTAKKDKVKIGKYEYHITKEYMNPKGKFRIPNGHWHFNDAIQIPMAPDHFNVITEKDSDNKDVKKKVRKEPISKLTPEKMREAVELHVASDALRSFSQTALTPITQLLIICGCVVLVGGAVWYGVKMETDKIVPAVTNIVLGVPPTPVP